MRKVLPVILLSVMFASMYLSCKKPYIPVRIETLFAHTWKLSGYQVNGQEQSINDCSENSASNLWYFYPSQNGTMKTTMNCENIHMDNDSTIAADSVTFTFAVTGDQRNMYVNGFGSANYGEAWMFVNMSNTQFQVQGAYQLNGVNYMYYKTFTAVN